MPPVVECERAGREAKPADPMASLLESDGSGFVKTRVPYLRSLRQASPEIWTLLERAGDVEQARSSLYTHLDHLERALFAAGRPHQLLQRATIRECLRTLRDLIGPANEQVTGSSALQSLHALARRRQVSAGAEVSRGFLVELIHLLRGVAGGSNIYPEGDGLEARDLLAPGERPACSRRMDRLDAMARGMREFLDRYPSGMDAELVRRTGRNRQRILERLGGSDRDWENYRWQLKHVVKDAEVLKRFIELSEEEEGAVRRAVEHRIPFGITPYYLSLLAPRRSAQDLALRAQVLPPVEYVDAVIEKRSRPDELDFMGERHTSPVPLVTRRYPGIAVLKPHDSCAQVCVYCQRNWQLRECSSVRVAGSGRKLARAIDWIRAHSAIGEVLVSGGDPLVSSDRAIRSLLDQLAAIDHVYRIRIGTRTLVALPQRWSGQLPALLARYHQPGRREVAVVTHFQHPAEITHEAMQAVAGIRRQGLSVYNQQVFTVQNSRRFETCKLRLLLRSIGVDPYYTFNMKGKEETRPYMVPIARLLQEHKEEARLLPGLDRTDEPVFNVPRLGKNHLRSWQDHRLLGIRPDGRRVYGFHPWEKNISLVPAFTYVDVSILDYLEGLAARGEDIREYRTIWYYF